MINKRRLRKVKLLLQSDYREKIKKVIQGKIQTAYSEHSCFSILAPCE